MISRLFLIAFCLLLGAQAFAALTLVRINLSRFSRGVGKDLGQAIAQNNNVIYGGVAGQCDGSPTATCNSCATLDLDTDPTGCNTRRIHNNLLFEITMTTDTAGTVEVTTDFGPGAGQTPLNFSANVPTTQIIQAGTTFTISLAWREICEKVFNMSGGCDNPGAANLSSPKGVRFGVSTDGNVTLDQGEFLENIQFVIADLSEASQALCTPETESDDIKGACNFVAYPGDQKVFVENVRANCGFPNIDGSGANVRFVRVFYQEASKGFPNQVQGGIADLEINQTKQNCVDSTQIISLKNNEVTGLNNETPYRFAVGTVDEAMNVGFVTQHDENLTINDKNECYGGTGDEWSQNCHMATPAEVIGLIEDEFDCFITTATYGSPFRPKVETFRAFRNQYLKTNWLGQKVIHTYYQTSPPLARWIRNHPEVKPIMRVILWPLWLFASLCLQAPMLVLLGLLAFFALVTRKTFQKGFLK